MIDIASKTPEELRELNAKGLLRRKEIPEYILWKAMKQRCGNPDNAAFRSYGGRGILVCPEWQADFFAWLQHVGRRPKPWLTLERINNNQGYQPGNVCWKTMKEQANNRRQENFTKVTKEQIVEIRERRGIEAPEVTASDFGITKSYVIALQLGRLRNTDGYERPPNIGHVGELNGRSILTEADVSNIKGLLLLDPWPGLIAELARRYNVGYHVIRMIAIGESWPHVEPSATPIMPPSREPPIPRRMGL